MSNRRLTHVRTLVAFLFGSGFALTACTALGHPGHGMGAQDLQGGMIHPLLGVDHLLAVVLVGIATVTPAGRAAWNLPLIYCLSMAVAAVVGHQFGSIDGQQTGACLAVIALGAVLPFVGHSARQCWWPLVLVTGLIQGYAHGSETAGVMGSAPYLTGLLTATAGLLVSGASVAMVARRMQVGTGLLKTSGVLTALSGIVVLIDRV